MIESELEKGFEDLSGVRAWAIAKRMGQEGQFNILQMYGNHETRWGVWRPYLIEDEELLNVCEEYRSLIRELRVASATLRPEEIDQREPQVGKEMSEKARMIAALLNKRGW